MKRLLPDIIKEQPEEYAHDINMHGACLDNTIVILDDDFTGCQTVHDVPVLFTWEMETLVKLLQDKVHIFFILVNTRSKSEEEAIGIINEVMMQLKVAGRRAKRDFTLISRSESALRGHFPAELNAIEKYMGGEEYLKCLIPAFFEGGRYTCDDIHYIKEEEYLKPAAETLYATDKVFGYKNSNLKEYISEKTEGRISSDKILSFSVKELRELGPDNVKKCLMESPHSICIVNALSKSDLDVFAAGAWEAIIAGKKLLFRTAPSFINSFGCVPVKEVMESSALKRNAAEGGLVIVGSLAEKSTNQMMQLLERGSAIPIELEVKQFIKGNGEKSVVSVSKRMNQLIKKGEHVLLYTSRTVIREDDNSKNLNIGKIISSALVEIVANLNVMPSFIITRGGTTTHDIAVRALNIKESIVIGLALPGVPVIIPKNIQEMKYVIFPANLGGDDDLLKLFNRLI